MPAGKCTVRGTALPVDVASFAFAASGVRLGMPSIMPGSSGESLNIVLSVNSTRLNQEEERHGIHFYIEVSAVTDAL